MIKKYKKKRYKIEQDIGQGGMGCVYLAKDSKNRNRQVAIKVIHPQNLGFDNCLERLKREARYLLRLSHPNIVHLYDFFEENNQFFLVMEYIKGIDLEEIFVSGQILSVEEKLIISHQLVSAIHAMNSEGLIHRDIKPSNIIYIAKKQQIKLVDLGIAKSISTQSQTCNLTKTSSVLGTPGYMSPEQVNGDTTEKSDVFTTAIVIYQLFANLRNSPFLGANNINTMLKISTQQLPSLQNVTEEEIPHVAQLSQVLQRALCKEASQRISIEDFYQEIRKITSKYLPTGEHCISSVPKTQVRRKLRHTAKSKKSTTPWNLYITLSLALILGVSLALISWGQHSQQELLQDFSHIMQNFSERKFDETWRKNEKLLTQYPQSAQAWMLKSLMLHDGMGVLPQRYASEVIAKQWHKKLSKNSKYTHYFLAKCYLYGLGTPQNLATALTYAKKTSLKAFPLAFTCMGEIYLKQGKSRAAFQAFSKGKDLGETEAMRQLAMFHLHGNTVPQNGQKALELLKQSFTLGNIFASNSIGYIHYNGVTLVPQNVALGEAWFMKGVERGDFICINNMATIYLNEHGTNTKPRKTLVEIAKMFTIAAQNNYDLAMRALGNMYIRHFERPYQGLFWIIRAILHGNQFAKNDMFAFTQNTTEEKIHAQILLGNNYARYVFAYWCMTQLQQPTNALYWLIQAHSNDKQQLGIIDDISMYQQKNNIIPRSKTKEAYVVKGFFYEKGIGVDIDAEKAHEYYKKAVKLGENSPKVLQKIK